MQSMAAQARGAAVLWLAGFCQACCLIRVVVFSFRSRLLVIRLVQCFLLNGLIFLGSIFTLRAAVMPILLWILPDQCQQSEAHACQYRSAMTLYSLLRPSLVWIFYALWLYPLYACSFMLSALWYNDIAKLAFDVQKKETATKSVENITTELSVQSEGLDGIIVGIGEQVYSFFLLNISFIEIFLAGYIPYLGRAISFFLLSLIYAYFSFEYKWNFHLVSLNKRLDLFESNWAFFSGFGSPCVLLTFFLSPLVGFGVMQVLFPLFILTAVGTEVEQVIGSLRKADLTELPRFRFFFFTEKITTGVVQKLLPNARKVQ